MIRSSPLYIGVRKCPEENIPHAAQALHPSSGLVSGRIESPTPRKIAAIIKMGRNPDGCPELDNILPPSPLYPGPFVCRPYCQSLYYLLSCL